MDEDTLEAVEAVEVESIDIEKGLKWFRMHSLIESDVILSGPSSRQMQSGQRR